MWQYVTFYGVVLLAQHISASVTSFSEDEKLQTYSDENLIEVDDRMVCIFK